MNPDLIYTDAYNDEQKIGEREFYVIQWRDSPEMGWVLWNNIRIDADVNEVFEGLRKTFLPGMGVEFRLVKVHEHRELVRTETHNGTGENK